jgi:Xaa-Pro aminopeptidase
MNKRLLRVLSLLKTCKADAALISSPITISYLTGYRGFTSMEREGYLLVTKNKSFLLATTLRVHEIQQKQNLEIIEINSVQTFEQTVKKIIEKNNINTLCIEENNLTVNEYKALDKKIKKIIDLPIRNLRTIKTKQEISQIKKACDIANKALVTVQPGIKPGVTEEEVAFQIEIAIRKLGAHIAFPTIVAFGKNAAIPHHTTDNTRLKTNDLILIDFGATYNGYCSDMTRTFFVGEPKSEWRKAYKIVKDAQKKSVDLVYHILTYDTQVIKASDVDKAARDYIVSQGYPSIPHSLGHGIGLEVHEAPSLSPNSKDLLEDGMVFSIEPGIYLQGKLGIRIEDLFAIKKNKLVQLT